MQQDVLKGPMRVPQLQRRRSNLLALESTLELVARVQQSQAAIEVRIDMYVRTYTSFMPMPCVCSMAVRVMLYPSSVLARGSGEAWSEWVSGVPVDAGRGVGLDFAAAPRWLLLLLFRGLKAKTLTKNRIRACLYNNPGARLHPRHTYTAILYR